MEKICNKMCEVITPLPMEMSLCLSTPEAVCKLIAKMNEIVRFANAELSQKLQEYIEAQFNNIMVGAVYDSASETITLKKERM